MVGRITVLCILITKRNGTETKNANRVKGILCAINVTLRKYSNVILLILEFKTHLHTHIHM